MLLFCCFGGLFDFLWVCLILSVFFCWLFSCVFLCCFCVVVCFDFCLCFFGGWGGGGGGGVWCVIVHIGSDANITFSIMCQMCR